MDNEVAERLSVAEASLADYKRRFAAAKDEILSALPSDALRVSKELYALQTGRRCGTMPIWIASNPCDKAHHVLSPTHHLKFNENMRSSLPKAHIVIHHTVGNHKIDFYYVAGDKCVYLVDAIDTNRAGNPINIYLGQIECEKIHLVVLIGSGDHGARSPIITAGATHLITKKNIPITIDVSERPMNFYSGENARNVLDIIPKEWMDCAEFRSACSEFAEFAKYESTRAGEHS